MVLSWFENFTENEVPPEHLWEDDEGLEQWWEIVKARRDDGLPGPSSASSDDSEDVMTGNDLGSQFKEMF